MVRKVVILGPESTGKSTLCNQLANHFNTIWCPEYAREYLLKKGNEYSYEDLLTIAKSQLELEDEYTTRVKEKDENGILFIDTDMHVMQVWAEYVFDKCHPFILQQIATRDYDLFLLCKTDLPWVADELREYPDHQTRENLYLMYKDLMSNQSVAWVEISGSDEQRLNSAIMAVEAHLLKTGK